MPVISIHALHEESDKPDLSVLKDMQFQSTLSMRRATGHWLAVDIPRFISIHALHEESDKNDSVNYFLHRWDFNPRSP